MLNAALELREAVHDVALGERAGQAWESWRDGRSGHAPRGGWCRVTWSATTRTGAAARRTPSARSRAGSSTPDTDFDAPLLAVAHAADDLLTSLSGTTVGACPGHGCGWLFTDRRRRRRWCSMAACGNRSKVRRFAERARQAVA